MTKGDLREEWKGIVDEFRDSGLTVAEWSRKHGIRAGNCIIGLQSLGMRIFCL